MTLDSANLVHLDLTGMDQITDMFFRFLLDKFHGNTFRTMKKINLTGCHYLTDWGIKWMAEIFPALSEVSDSILYKL